MHDPMTVAGSWPRYGTWLYKFGWLHVTLWHVDPETDGSDDSCGWSRPKFTKADEKIIADLVRDEQQSPWISTAQTHVRDPHYQYPEARPGDGLALTLMAYGEVAWAADNRRMDPRLVAEAMSLATHRHDNLMSCVCEPERLIRCVLRAYRRNRRRWWQHPRWHVHHWKIQIHFLQQLRRWLFARCAICGGRFAWGYCPTGDWGGKRIWHSDCSHPNSNCAEAASATVTVKPDSASLGCQHNPRCLLIEDHDGPCEFDSPLKSEQVRYRAHVALEQDAHNADNK